MDTQSGARSVLVDPFGRELEEWLRDVPATRTPYVADLVVPPVTGPIRRPIPEQDEPDSAVSDEEPALIAEKSEPETVAAPIRARDRARHASSAFAVPEPPDRCSLTFSALASAVGPGNGLTTLERLDLFEEQLRLQEADRARLTAWTTSIAGRGDAEASAARAYVHEIFADLVARVAPVGEAREPERLDEELDAVELADAASVRTAPTPLVVPATGPSAIDRQAFENAIRTHVLDAQEFAPTAAVEGAPVERADSRRETLAEEDEPTPIVVRASWWQRILHGLVRVFGRR